MVMAAICDGHGGYRASYLPLARKLAAKPEQSGLHGVRATKHDDDTTSFEQTLRLVRTALY